MYECAKSMLSDTTKISSGQYSLSEKKTLLQEFQSLRNQVYEEANVDYSGRSIFTGYKTNMDLAFKTADTTAKYRISEKFSGTDVDEINYVSGAVTVNSSDILSSTATEYNQNAIKNNSLYRIRLAYDDLSQNSIATAKDLSYQTSGKLNTDLTVAIAGSTTGYVKASVNLNAATGVVSATVAGTATAPAGGYTTTVGPINPATGKGTITINDAGGTSVGTFDYSLDGTTVTASKSVTVNAVSLADAGGSDAAYLNTSPEQITMIKETGELILGKGVYQSLQNCGEDAISFTYEKTGFAENELKPEHYFDCTNLNNGYEYKNENVSQNIDYIVNFNQTLTVNTEAKNLFDQSIGRDVDDMISALEGSIAAETKVTNLKAMLNDSQYSSKTEYIQSMIEACEKEQTYANNKLQELSKNSITNFSGYCTGIKTANTEVASKESRLALTKERALKQQTNLETLSQENIGVELSDVLVEQEEANLAYDAALSAASKIITHSLLDFL
jgi:flagellar hook-associated protein 3 FlgL